MLLFLDELSDGTYRILNRQGAFLIDGNGVEVSDAVDALVADLAALGPSGVRAALSSAADEAAGGFAQPVEPGS